MAGGKKGDASFVPFIPANGRKVKWYTCGCVLYPFVFITTQIGTTQLCLCVTVLLCMPLNVPVSTSALCIANCQRDPLTPWPLPLIRSSPTTASSRGSFMVFLARRFTTQHILATRERKWNLRDALSGATVCVCVCVCVCGVYH